MLVFAIKMLVGDRAKFFGMLLGLTFASFIITQQAGIFIGLMQRTYGFIRDTSQPDLWVMDKEVRYIDDIKPIKTTKLYNVQGVSGVDWAVPLFKGLLKARLSSGKYEVCNVIGIDDSSLIGGPPKMIEGKVIDLRIPDGVIVNKVGAKDRLAKEEKSGKKIPMRVGDRLEINDHRAVVVGIAEVTRTFQSQPVIYTTIDRAVMYAPSERNLLSYILVKAKPGISPKELAQKIRRETKLAVYTRNAFEWKTVEYFVKNTGILLNFGFAVLLGFIIGTAIAGQTFYNFALDNLRYFGAYKAMGATHKLLIKMIILQAIVMALLGWGVGMFATSLFAIFSYGTDLSFKMPWQLYIASGLTMLVITSFGAILSMIKIVRLDPAIVFKGT
ncbi:MAG: ABC transporter permease [Chlamydiia bacterium]|nr:ABC transporter permease [Chlamydiia bacterium]